MSLESFFNPKSMAIVGASRQKGKVGYEILVNVIGAGYKGEIFPVNPKSDTIEGLKCYPDLKSIGKTPDLVIIIIPAKFVSAMMQQCAKVGVKSVIIITAGFKEVGKEGRELEKQVLHIARQAGIKIIGPNCLGGRRSHRLSLAVRGITRCDSRYGQREQYRVQQACQHRQ